MYIFKAYVSCPSFVFFSPLSPLFYPSSRLFFSILLLLYMWSQALYAWLYSFFFPSFFRLNVFVDVNFKFSFYSFYILMSKMHFTVWTDFLLFLKKKASYVICISAIDWFLATFLNERPYMPASSNDAIKVNIMSEAKKKRYVFKRESKCFNNVCTWWFFPTNSNSNSYS